MQPANSAKSTKEDQQHAQPLHGVRVLELGRVLAAPFCAQMLGDAGADVIKIEIPNTGDESRAYGPPFVEGQSYYFLSLNRNKRSITLNLKHEGARNVLRRLIQSADVFVHNSLPGPMERLGFSYEQVRPLNPRLVYCAISGFGQTGPQRDTPSLDMMAQALSGIMSLTGQPDGAPMRAGLPIADLSTGMVAAYAIMLALFQRQQTGEGQMVSTSLIESAMALLTYQAGRYFVTGETVSRFGNAHPSIVPYDSYPTADGWVTIAVVNDSTWKRFCQATGLHQLEHDPRFATNAERVRHREDLDGRIRSALAGLTTAQLLQQLQEANVPHGAVRDLDAVFTDEQVRHLNLRRSTPHPRTGRVEYVGAPYHLSASAPERASAPPYLGEQTDEILAGLGLSPSQVDALRRDGAI